MVEPVFGQITANRRSGASNAEPAAAGSERRLIAATHNLLTLYRHTSPPRRPRQRTRSVRSPPGYRHPAGAESVPAPAESQPELHACNAAAHGQL